ncbi:MAG: hypothetical protein JXR10_02130 [Cyclobacteriaceae bacterium]
MQAYQWIPFSPINKEALVNCRKQLHVAVQTVAAIGRKFLPPSDEDQNATLIWVPGLKRMAGKWVEANVVFRSSISLDTMQIHLVDRKVSSLASFQIADHTQVELMLWLEEQIGQLGLHAPHLTLNLPYKLPDYSSEIAEQKQPFDLQQVQELGKYYNNSFVALRNIKEKFSTENEITIWPHHFDQALQVKLKDSGDAATDTLISFGMSPGDDEFESPYFYVNTWPHIDTSKCDKLDNNAIWVSEEWTGAVLFAKHVIDRDQQLIVERFYEQAQEQLVKLLIN